MKTKNIKILNTRRRAAKNNFIKIMKMEGGAQSQKHNVSGQIRKPFSSTCEISRLNVLESMEKTQNSCLISVVWNNSRSLSSIIAGQVHKQKYKHTRQIVWSQNWLWWPWTEVDVTRRKKKNFFLFFFVWPMKKTALAYYSLQL